MVTRSTPSVSEAARAYLKSKSHCLSEGSASDYARTLRRFAEHAGDIQVGRLTEDHVEDFLHDLLARNARGKRSRASTVNNTAAKLRPFLAFCGRKNWGRADLLEHFGTVKADVRKDFLLLSADELLTLLERAAHPRDRFLYALGMNTALRAGEMLSLTAGQWDSDNGEFYVVIPKSNTQDYMPITLELQAEFERWRGYYEDDIGRELKGSDHLLPSLTRPIVPRNGVPSPPQRITLGRPMIQPGRRVKAGLRALGYSDERLEKEGCHTLRRSTARLYFDSLRAIGYDFALKETQTLLHHANSSTTEGYLGLSVDRANRDTRLRGQAFLTTLTTKPAEVTPLRKEATNG